MKALRQSLTGARHTSTISMLQTYIAVPYKCRRIM